jgi:tape measure domain-containing protein
MAENLGTAYITILPEMKGTAARISAGLASGMPQINAGISRSLSSGVSGGFLKGMAGLKSNTLFAGLNRGLTRTMKVMAGTVSAGVGGLVAGVTSQIGRGIQRADTMKNFPVMMRNLGYSLKDAEGAVKELSKGVDGLPTSLDAVVATTQQLAPLSKNLGDATKTTLALNNAFLASGASEQDAARGLLQYSQMLARGKVDLMGWRSLQETMPSALSQVAKKMGIASGNTTELYDKLSKGKLSMDDLNQAFQELNKKGLPGYKNLAQQAADATNTVAARMANLKTALAKFWENIFFDETKMESTVFGSKVTEALDVMKGLVGGVVSELKSTDMQKVLGDAMMTVTAALKSIDPKAVAQVISDSIRKVISAFNWLVENGETVKKVVIGVVGAFGLVKGLSFLSGAAKGILSVQKAIASFSGGKAASAPAGKALEAFTGKAGILSKLVGMGGMLAGTGVVIAALPALVEGLKRLDITPETVVKGGLALALIAELNGAGAIQGMGQDLASRINGGGIDWKSMVAQMTSLGLAVGAMAGVTAGLNKLDITPETVVKGGLALALLAEMTAGVAIQGATDKIAGALVGAKKGVIDWKSMLAQVSSLALAAGEIAALTVGLNALEITEETVKKGGLALALLGAITAASGLMAGQALAGAATAAITAFTSGANVLGLLGGMLAAGGEVYLLTQALTGLKIDQSMVNKANMAVALIAAMTAAQALTAIQGLTGLAAAIAAPLSFLGTFATIQNFTQNLPPMLAAVDDLRSKYPDLTGYVDYLHKVVAVMSDLNIDAGLQNIAGAQGIIGNFISFLGGGENSLAALIRDKLPDVFAAIAELQAIYTQEQVDTFGVYIGSVRQVMEGVNGIAGLTNLANAQGIISKLVDIFNGDKSVKTMFDDVGAVMESIRLLADKYPVVSDWVIYVAGLKDMLQQVNDVAALTNLANGQSIISNIIDVLNGESGMNTLFSGAISDTLAEIKTLKEKYPKTKELVKYLSGLKGVMEGLSAFIDSLRFEAAGKTIKGQLMDGMATQAEGKAWAAALAGQINAYIYTGVGRQMRKEVISGMATPDAGRNWATGIAAQMDSYDFAGVGRRAFYEVKTGWNEAKVDLKLETSQNVNVNLVASLDGREMARFIRKVALA